MSFDILQVSLLKRVWTIKRIILIIWLILWNFSMPDILVTLSKLVALFSRYHLLSEVISQTAHVVALLQVIQYFVHHWVFLRLLNIFFHLFNYPRNMRELRWSLRFSSYMRNKAQSQVFFQISLFLFIFHRLNDIFIKINFLGNSFIQFS